MRRGGIIAWALSVFATAAVSAQGPASGASVKAATATFNRLFAAYAAGDHTVVLTQLKTVADCNAIRPGIEPSTTALLMLTPKPVEWRRERAAFILELANDISQCAPKELWVLLSAGRSYLTARSNLLGASADDDAFELRWWLIAAAILQREHGPDQTDVFIDTIERRYVTSPSAKAARTTLDPRFELMRAINAEQRASTTKMTPLATALTNSAANRAGDVSTQAQQTTVTGPALYTGPTAARPAYLAAAAKVLERAAAIEVIAPEANVRLAAVRFQLGQFAEALAAIERARVPPADRALAYWAGLWRGRILDALSRPADAERAYAQALEAWPTGQAAGVGVALMRFKQNRRPEAAEASLRVQSMPPGAPDPWWTYLGGDGRFVGPWLGELRKTLTVAGTRPSK